MENCITLTGAVMDYPLFSHEYHGENYYVVVIKSGYLRRNKPAQSFIRVYLTEPAAVNLGVIPGTFVTVKGFLINSVHDGHKDVSVIAEHVFIEDAEEGEFSNEARLTGVITRVFTNESNFVNFVNFLVSAPNSENRRSVSLRVVAWSTLASYIFENLKIGDTVTVIGSINSSNYSPGNQSSYSESANKILISELYCTSCSKMII